MIYHHFSGEVVRRMFPGKEYDKFVEEYQDHRLKGRERRVTEKDKLIFMDWKKGGMTMAELIRKHKSTQQKIRTSIVLASKI